VCEFCDGHVSLVGSAWAGLRAGSRCVCCGAGRNIRDHDENTAPAPSLTPSQESLQHCNGRGPRGLLTSSSGEAHGRGLLASSAHGAHQLQGGTQCRGGATHRHHTRNGEVIAPHSPTSLKASGSGSHDRFGNATWLAWGANGSTLGVAAAARDVPRFQRLAALHAAWPSVQPAAACLLATYAVTLAIFPGFLAEDIKVRHYCPATHWRGLVGFHVHGLHAARLIVKMITRLGKAPKHGVLFSGRGRVGFSHAWGCGCR
jgi:hypothetical protein